jgi:hypothetical protein
MDINLKIIVPLPVPGRLTHSSMVLIQIQKRRNKMKAGVNCVKTIFFLALAIAAPSCAADTPQCNTVKVPEGWVTIADTTDSSCGPGVNNKRTIRDLLGLPTDAEQAACNDGIPIPTGWVVVAIATSAACGPTGAVNTGYTLHNVTGSPTFRTISACLPTAASPPPFWVISDIQTNPGCGNNSTGNARLIKNVDGEAFLAQETVCSVSPLPPLWTQLGAPASGGSLCAGTNIIVIENHNPAATHLTFTPVTQCRVMDTRASQGQTGPFGPPSLSAGTSRAVPVQSSSCGIPATALAYSLNITVVPQGPLGYLTAWATSKPMPATSIVNAMDGNIRANAAIVAADSAGSISLFATNATDVVIDINGYFAPPTPQALVFYPLAACRVADTGAQGTTGAFGPPTLTGGAVRTLPMLSSACGIPASAQAYSLNFTVVPPGPLGVF